ncbi:hypothetical protein MKW94_008194 [Papaver nudicaule]|uniref:Uncharacterized protein n=1 Tax=Papaver nudicaule TaxID=74823 RepID=A0AA41W2N4_PAPNU|nr:hypothetical protein [Papaver nudicaule]
MSTTHSVSSTLYFITTQNPLKTPEFPFQTQNISYSKCYPNFCLNKKSTSSTKSQFLNKFSSISCQSLSTASPINTKNYEFTDGGGEVELRLQLGEQRDSKDIFVDANEDSITIRVKSFGSIITLIETTDFYGKIKPAETIWLV